MTAQGMSHRKFTAWNATELTASVIVAIVGGLFAAEGLLGYFYNSSMFLEGMDHVWEIYGGLAVAIVGLIVSAYILVRR